ncbi:hypothetical protein UFOVP1382_106 [uncultured Caudovirales phage]|uniref:Uncharacterized protein n=1 Tax=uncultured Caudovirales phage TaxID=2100421 RepID=A0A6J5RXU1_9CAUD|nr:hypothetical protein UFOVP1382_106 [uncultured Caudovirales phage]
MRAEYRIVSQSPSLVVITDVGSARGKMSVTNDAEAVVQDLHQNGVLVEGAALHYYDSEGELAGLAWEGREDSVGFYAVLDGRRQLGQKWSTESEPDTVGVMATARATNGMAMIPGCPTCAGHGFAQRACPDCGLEPKS